MTGVCFPLELGIVGSRLMFRKEEFFSRNFSSFTKADFDKAKARSEKFFKNKIWIKTQLIKFNYVGEA